MIKLLPHQRMRGTMSEATTQFTVPAAADTVAAVIGDREFLIQGDRRYTYAQIVERSNRLAAYLHSRGLGCQDRAFRRLPVTRSGRICWASTPTTDRSTSRRCSALGGPGWRRSTSTTAT